MKKTVSLIALAMAVTAGIASASVPENQLNIGGVAYHATQSETDSICGQPVKTKTEQKSYGQKTECKYANGLEVTFVDGFAQKIEFDRLGDLATAGGIKIGMEATTLQNVYGQPDMIKKGKYIYYMDGNHDVGLVFEIKNGTVHEIECGRLH